MASGAFLFYVSLFQRLIYNIYTYNKIDVILYTYILGSQKIMTDSNIKKILLVDDDAEFAKIVGLKLKADGYEVFFAENGEIGIEKAKEIKPDLTVMDMKMPVMNGIEAFNKLKEDPEAKNLKVAFLTSLGEPDKEEAWLDEKFAREIGAEDYINKSEGPLVIAKNIKKLIEE